MQNEKHQTTAGKHPLVGWLFAMLKGALIGVGAILPGISGGVLCVVLGIYQPLMELMAHPLREMKKNFLFFLPILLGFAVGVLGISKLLQLLLDEAETPAVWLFIGLILGTFPSVWREAGKEGRGKGSPVAMAVAFVAMLVLMLLVRNSGAISLKPSIWMWFLCGALWGLGIIAPGLSPSSMFFYFGVMEAMMAGISKLSMPVLLPMGTGMILCLLLLSRGIGHLLKTRYAVTMHAILGLMLASTVMILPLSVMPSVTEALLYALCFAVGIVIALWMDRINRKMVSSGLKE
jgi:putative membrane protein